jgi:restriction endonuclease S subunit
MQYSIVNLKTVKENSDFRIDAEYYRPDYLEFLNQINLKKKFYLKKILHPTEIKRIYEDSGLQILLAQNVRNNEFDFSNIVYMSEDVKEKLKRNKLQYDDVVLTRSGANFGQSASFKQKQDIYACADVLVIKNTQDFKGGYLSTFLNTKQGRSLLDRGSYGMAQPHIASSYLYNLPIPKFNENFENIVDDLVNKSEKFKDQSKSLYSQAEQLLLSELGLLGWKPKHTLTFIKNFSATQEAERMDAEYFQPKYEEIIEAVKKYKGGFVTLGEVAKTKRGSLIPDSFYNNQNGTPYIRGADFSSGFLSDDKLIYIDDSFSQKSETKIKKGDIIFALIGTVGSTALVDNNFNGAFISNNIGKITLKAYNPTVLQVLLHSIIGKLYFEKEQTQTAQPKISDKDIHKFILPILENKIEKEIEQKYFESLNSKNLSKSLLEIAKRGVEMAIEKDEQEAGKWINGEIEKLGVKIQ